MPSTPLRVAFAKPWPGTRRGLKLWILSIIIGLKGFGYARGATSNSTEYALQLITDRLHIPLQLCGAFILAICVFALLCSYCHYGRDRYGYMALVGFSFGWAGAFAASPLFLDGPQYGYQGTLTYVLLGMFLLLCASDPEPVKGSGL